MSQVETPAYHIPPEIVAAVVRLRRNPTWDPDVELVLNFITTGELSKAHLQLIGTARAAVETCDRVISKQVDNLGLEWVDVKDCPDPEVVKMRDRYAVAFHDLSNAGRKIRGWMKALGI